MKIPVDTLLINVSKCELPTPKKIALKTTGYSGASLIKKLGIDPGEKVLHINAPKNYFELIGDNFQSQLIPTKELPDLIHLL